MQIRKSVVAALPFDLAEEVNKFAIARACHALTVDQPAPTAHPLVEAIVCSECGYEVIDDDDEVQEVPKDRLTVVEERMQVLQQMLQEHTLECVALHNSLHELLAKIENVQLRLTVLEPSQGEPHAAVEVPLAPEGARPEDPARGAEDARRQGDAGADEQP